MRQTKTLNQIELVKVSNCSDVHCTLCGSSFIVKISWDYKKKWRIFSSPNKKVILKKYPGLSHFLKIRPDAVAFVNVNIEKSICPCCNQKTMVITKGSEYDKHLLLESLDA